MAKTRSKFFRAFVEGDTISDGRKIDKAMIDSCVATFNAETYTPRCNVEHIAGFSPEPPFNGYGDVVAVEARDDELVIAGKTEKRRALYCQVDANEQLLTLQKKDQKPFCSVELTDSYAGTGKVGLVGLAFTDTPASIGTQRLQFARMTNAVFASGDERVAPEFETPAPDQAGLASAISTGLANAFAKLGFKPAEEKPKDEVKPPKPANDNFDPAVFSTAIGEATATAISTAIAPLTEKLTALTTDFGTLKTKVETTPAPGQFQRGPATGGDAKAVVTDC